MQVNARELRLTIFCGKESNPAKPYATNPVTGVTIHVPGDYFPRDKTTWEMTRHTRDSNMCLCWYS